MKNISQEYKLTAYKAFLAINSQSRGPLSCRNIFIESFEVLKEEEIVEIGLKFFYFEKELGEIDRSRDILIFLSQYCEPELEPFGFWEVI